MRVPSHARYFLIHISQCLGPEGGTFSILAVPPLPFDLPYITMLTLSPFRESDGTFFL